MLSPPLLAHRGLPVHLFGDVAVQCGSRPLTANVQVAKVAPKTATAGGTIEYTLKVTNLGPATATDVRVSDKLSSQLAAVTGLPRGCFPSLRRP